MRSQSLYSAATRSLFEVAAARYAWSSKTSDAHSCSTRRSFLTGSHRAPPGDFVAQGHSCTVASPRVVHLDPVLDAQT